MTTMKTMTTTMKKIMLISTATKVDDDKPEEALHSMRTQLSLYSPQVLDPPYHNDDLPFDSIDYAST